MPTLSYQVFSIKLDLKLCKN